MEALHQHVDQVFKPLTNWVVNTLNLPIFADHASTFYISFFSFVLVHISSAYLSRWIFPNIYPQLPRRTRYFWTVHWVSMAHALVVVPWSFLVVTTNMPKIDDNKAFGWDPRLGGVQSVAFAYFVWDTVETTLGGSGYDMILHGATCSFIYGLGYRPWCAYYGPRALLWETSTIFLNIHWFLDKAGKTGSKVQLINGLMLLAAFFFGRLMYGGYISYDFISTLWNARNEVPVYQTLGYAVGNITLNILNWFWFSKMIAALRKRFDSNETIPATVKVEGDKLYIPDAKAIKSALPNGKKATKRR